MKPLKTLGLAALTALMAMAVIGASSAMAGSTVLCGTEGATCASPKTHIHEESVGHAELLSSFATVKCEALFLGDTLNGGAGAPLIIHGTFTYTCLNSCTATEENGPAEIKVLNIGGEEAEVTGEGLVHVVCGLNCRYNGVGLKGEGFGALAAGNGVGEVSIEAATVNKESGTFCPSTSKLDITTEPLSATYIGSKGGGGEEGKPAMNIDPAGYLWTGWFSKEFKIQNTGSTTWTISGFWTYSSEYEVVDSGKCFKKTLSPGQSCSIHVTGKSTSHESILEAWAESGGKEVANKISYLNIGH